jgi:hypothetical protein
MRPIPPVKLAATFASLLALIVVYAAHGMVLDGAA